MSTLAIGPSYTHRPRSARSAAPVRLTRRGRIVLTVFFVAALLVAFAAFGPHSAATGEAGTPVPTRTVQVGEGDTLWDIASEVAEPGQVREMVHQIEELNALPGPSLVAGQTIAVPVR
ncbi:MAG: LysM peptidoglycan-binding domain-containing protein [Nocardioidaceae bacterium]